MSDNINRNDMLRVGTILHGTYRIDGYLSSGGFGNTYVATDTSRFDERYAIKEFYMSGITERDANSTTVSVSNANNKATFESQLEKFKKEALRLHNLKNEHIVHVYALFEENNTAYYVMDYIDGENLSEHLKQTGKPLSEGEVLKILSQILNALDAAHQANLYHLDLKPANIMVDSRGVVKLIDFGASKQQRPDGNGATTNSTTIAYTPGYAPIEQIEQSLDEFGPWTDFYALGATLYTLLSNKKPPSPTKISRDGSLEKKDTLPLPSAVTAETKRLVLWLMNYDTQKRPQNIKEILDYLAKNKIITKTVSGSSGENSNGIDDRTLTKETEGGDSGDDTFVEERKKKHQDNEGTSKGKKGKKNGKKKKPIVKRVLNIRSRGRRRKIAFALIAAVTLIAIIIVLAIQNHKTALPTPITAESTNNEVISNLISNMVEVEGGTFTLGATPEQGRDADQDEKPTHEVTLSSYYIGKYEVTQRLWQAVMGSNPSKFKGDNRPVECVSWDDCQAFIRKLNQLTGKHFRLPTEAEWEYAARGGNRSKGYKYAGSDNIDNVAWYDDNSGSTTHDVGLKQPNELGLYDMSGNVWEWCSDGYGSYSSSAQTNPRGASSGSNRVYRGGSWIYYAGCCRVSFRGYDTPDSPRFNLGLRLVL